MPRVAFDTSDECIMATISHLEQCFVETYIVAERRQRYLTFLKGRKHRQKILERLNHSLDYDKSKAQRLDASFGTVNAIIPLLRSYYALEDSCHLMADGNPYDGGTFSLKFAVSELVSNRWGALIICPTPGSVIALYMKEDPGGFILLSDLNR
jgi:hypothetical protein